MGWKTRALEAEVARLTRREAELLEANNRYFTWSGSTGPMRQDREADLQGYGGFSFDGGYIRGDKASIDRVQEAFNFLAVEAAIRREIVASRKLVTAKDEDLTLAIAELRWIQEESRDHLEASLRAKKTLVLLLERATARVRQKEQPNG
jgi:hypothetical protein